MGGAETAAKTTSREYLGEREYVCEKHGRFISQGILVFGKELWLRCPRCQEEINAREQRADDENNFEIERRRLSVIPERYRCETFDTYKCASEKQRRVVSLLREYRGEKNIVIYGPPGTGKTHLLWALVKANREAVYWKLSDVIRRVKCSFSPTARESEEDILRELAGVKILALDEVGRGNGRDFEANLIFDLIDMRYSSRLPTILCSNLPPSGGENSMAAYIGDTAIDRINENAVNIFCDWENYRKK